MLELEVMLEEGFDEEKSEIVPIKSGLLELEHSLVSLSKWESKWKKAFLDKKLEKTPEMFLDYINCMIVSGDPILINYLSQADVNKISEYINDSHTATFFSEDGPDKPKKINGKIVTSDLIYYWMSALTIPFTCETWHLNRLITLIRVAEAENRPKKNMSRKEAMNRHRSLNASRRAR